MSTHVAVLEETTEPQEQENTSDTLSPYRYAEFTGPGGERYLKKLLRQILPMALYRTWEIFADHQARGNECYLSVTQLAALAGRSLRTMQKNMASLQARHLLVERAERKVFRGREGENTSRMVVVKDFAALYALAHEYDTWLHVETYIPPDRVFLSVLTQDQELVAKLRRFNNYHRVLYTQLPGPGPRAHEEDSWFTTYHPEHGNTTDGHHQGTADDWQSPSVPTPKLPAKDPAKESPKRINESSHRDVSTGDSCDSVFSFSENPLRKEEGGENTSQEQYNQESNKKREQTTIFSPTVQTLPPFPTLAIPSIGDSRPASTGTHAETNQAVRLARQAMALTGHGHPGQWGHSQDQRSTPPRPPDHLLARSFVHEIAVPFGDRNLRGSTTRILKIVAHAALEDAEVLLCLVRAYTVARQTRTLRPEHAPSEGGPANRMPLFCTLFERFVQARVQNGKWNYSWQQMEDDLAADDRLLLWWTEHQALLAKEEPDPREDPSAPVQSEHGYHE